LPTVDGSQPDTTGRLIDVTPPDTDAPSSADAQRLRAERDAAVARARELEMELGQLRGTVKRLELMMWRRTARRQLWQARLDRVMAKVRRS
jgi:hypothetical protein